MPRHARIRAQGLMHHVVHRGINRQPIFRCDADYHIFLRLMVKAATKQGVKLLAYCLMTNHFHLMLLDTRAALSEMMHALNGMYTSGFNRRHGCEGALLRGRFYSVPVRSDSHALTLFRYIHLNPVKAKMVQFAAQYPWSSYRSYLVHAEPSLVARDGLLALLPVADVLAEDIETWLKTAIPALDADCAAEEIDRWLLGKTKVQSIGSGHISPLLAAPSLPTSPAVAANSCAQQREDRLVGACAEVAQRHSLRLCDLAAPGRRSGLLAFQARAEAMLVCRDRYEASYIELSRLFCLAYKSIGMTLTRARLSFVAGGRRQL